MRFASLGIVVVAAVGLALSLATISQGGPRLENAPPPAVKDKVVDRFVPAAYDQQSISGLLGARMKTNLEGRLLKLDTAPLLAGFQKRPGCQEWIGEHVGKFLHAGSNAWAYSGDPALRARIDAVVKDLLATQKDDGYLGTYLDANRWTSWDVWVHGGDLIGLLAYYQMTGDKAALNACCKIGDLLSTTFGTASGQRDLMAAGEHQGLAPGMVLEPMCMLYRCTGNQRYLDFCRYIIKAYDESPRGPRLLKSLNEHGDVQCTADAKAYEMLLCLVGVTDLYRLTGDEALLKPCLAAWNDVVAHRLYITGTTSHREHFRGPGDLPGTGDVGEMCVTVTWLQLNWHLLRLTGEPKYAVEMERTIYNALLGAQHPTQGSICYFTPLIGTKPYNAVAHGVAGVNCCISSGQRGISLLPQFVWGTLDGGPVLWQYTAGEVTLPLSGGNKVKITSVTNYPLDGAVTLTVTPSVTTEFPLYLRVPAWCAKYTATVDGKAISGKAGELLKIERTWKPGDTVQVAIDMTVQLQPGGKSYPGCVAIQRGPQVLAWDKAMNPFGEGAVELKSTKPGDVTLGDVGIGLLIPGHERYERLPGVYLTDGKTDALVLVPFADAGR